MKLLLTFFILIVPYVYAAVSIERAPVTGNLIYYLIRIK